MFRSSWYWMNHCGLSYSCAREVNFCPWYDLKHRTVLFGENIRIDVFGESIRTASLGENLILEQTCRDNTLEHRFGFNIGRKYWNRLVGREHSSNLVRRKFWNKLVGKHSSRIAGRKHSKGLVVRLNDNSLVGWWILQISLVRGNIGTASLGEDIRIASLWEEHGNPNLFRLH